MKTKLFRYVMFGALLAMLGTSCGSLPKPGERPPAPPGAPARP